MIQIHIYDDTKHCIVSTYYADIVPADGGTIEVTDKTRSKLTSYKINTVCTVTEHERVKYVTLYVTPTEMLRGIRKL